jgi:hypothetical protein
VCMRDIRLRVERIDLDMVDMASADEVMDRQDDSNDFERENR